MHKGDTVPPPSERGAPDEPCDARADILHRIRSALRGATPSDIPRDYRTEDARERDEIVNLFAERVAEYRATVHRVRASRGRRTSVARIAERGRRAPHRRSPRICRTEWRPADGAARTWFPAVELVEDADLSVQQLDDLDGALTGCAVAIAEVGAFVLDAGRGQGRRALSLVPDLHICVVREDQVVGLVPEAVGVLEEAVRAGQAAHVRRRAVGHL